MRGIGQASRRPPRGKGAPPKAVKQVIINAAWYKGLEATAGSVVASLEAVQEMFAHGARDNILVFLPQNLLQQQSKSALAGAFATFGPAARR